MKTFLSYLIISIAIICLPDNVLAQGRGAQTFKTNVDGTVVFNPCSMEGVILSGNVVLVFRGQTDTTGALHRHLTVTGQGVTGIGMISATHYQVNGPFPNGLITQVVPGNGAIAFTSVTSFHLISRGSTDNFILHVLLHITVNANGDMTADVFSIIPVCAG